MMKVIRYGATSKLDSQITARERKSRSRSVARLSELRMCFSDSHAFEIKGDLCVP
jgi:hypothetical protein